MIQELRIYRFHPGQISVFLEEFKKAKRFMTKYGVTFVAAWTNIEKEEFVWIRSFSSEKAREKAIKRYYGSPEWLRIVDRLRPTIKRREVKILKALPYSNVK